MSNKTDFDQSSLLPEGLRSHPPLQQRGLAPSSASDGQQSHEITAISLDNLYPPLHLHNPFMKTLASSPFPQETTAAISETKSIRSSSDVSTHVPPRSLPIGLSNVKKLQPPRGIFSGIFNFTFNPQVNRPCDFGDSQHGTRTWARRNALTSSMQETLDIEMARGNYAEWLRMGGRDE
jgi:hypothetical protein